MNTDFVSLNSSQPVSVEFISYLVIILSVFFSPAVLECPVQVDEIYNGCFCFFEWNDANKVGNWTFEENWLQLIEPPWVGFVSVAGDNTVHVENSRRINELYVGPNRWDTTKLVIDEDLTIVYDDVPVISSVRGYRLTNGQIRLTIQGKGFGFVSSEIVVTAFEVVDIADHSGDHITNVYNCEHVTLGYRDALIQCNLAPIDNQILANDLTRIARPFR